MELGGGEYYALGHFPSCIYISCKLAIFNNLGKPKHVTKASRAPNA